MNCLYCHYFDKNDSANGWGTCEPQDRDFPSTHECNLNKDEVKELEGLTGHRRESYCSVHERETLGMKEPGVNIIFNGHQYHFKEPASLDELLVQTADSVSETNRDNTVLYDDELK